MSRQSTIFASTPPQPRPSVAPATTKLRPELVALPAAESGPRITVPAGRSTARDGGERRPTGWLRLEEAARLLGVESVTLRRAIDRHARRDADGRTFSEFDGVRARKLGRQWRIVLDPCWCLDAPA
jgi:hypothetical protein